MALKDFFKNMVMTEHDHLHEKQSQAAQEAIRNSDLAALQSALNAVKVQDWPESAAVFNKTYGPELLRLAVREKDLGVFNHLLETCAAGDPNTVLTRHEKEYIGRGVSAYVTVEEPLLYLAITGHRHDIALALAQNPRIDVTLRAYVDRNEKPELLALAEESGMVDVFGALALRKAELYKQKAAQLESVARRYVPGI